MSQMKGVVGGHCQTTGMNLMMEDAGEEEEGGAIAIVVVMMIQGEVVTLAHQGVIFVVSTVPDTMRLAPFGNGICARGVISAFSCTLASLLTPEGVVVMVGMMVGAIMVVGGVVMIELVGGIMIETEATMDREVGGVVATGGIVEVGVIGMSEGGDDEMGD